MLSFPWARAPKYGRRGTTIAAAATALALTPSIAQADTVVQAETLPATPSSSGGTFSDSTASGGKAFRLFANGSISTTVTTSTETVRLDVRAKGSQCDGGPKVAIYVDGTQRPTATVSSSTW